MKIKVLFMVLFTLPIVIQFKLSECQCSEITTEADCIFLPSLNCYWEESKCKDVPINKTHLLIGDYSYCFQFSKDECRKQYPCQFIGDECSHFTACSAFTKTNDSDCQAISQRCLSDGIQCFGIGECADYINLAQCKHKTLATSLCYWDNVNSICIEATECYQLSLYSYTDYYCRSKIKTCTVNSSQNGCIGSGINCKDQLNSFQCFYNLDKSQECYWDENKCVDKICDNAPKKYTTEQECKNFLGTCTTKAGGGCILRTDCTSAQVKEACVTNFYGRKCYWNRNICQDVPICQAAETEEDCRQYIYGLDCFWNIDANQCQDRICQNAPLKRYYTYELCVQFLKSCSFISDQGCATKTCENAPTNINSNGDCELYLPNHNCITKIKGGCVTNTTCPAISLEIACIKDRNGQICFWDNNSCKDKICLNAPRKNTTHDLCQQFQSTCTVNSSTEGCVDWTCETSQDTNLCSLKSVPPQSCIWKSKCYSKECSLAPSNYQSHTECNNYLKSCTLSNTGNGCMLIPLRCEAITLEDACVLRKKVNQITKIVEFESECGWDGKTCSNKSCITAPKQYNKTVDCNQYLVGCISANPNSTGQVQGCMDSPSNCSGRLTLDNCNGQCYWNPIQSKCLDNICTNLSLTSHEKCQEKNDTCTVNNSTTNCIRLKDNCFNYTNPVSCYITIDRSLCIWNNNDCTSKTCSDAPDSYDSDQECQNFKVTSDICTVVPKVGYQGCVNKKANCIEYTNSAQCHKTINNKTSKDNCLWHQSKCWDKSKFLCSQIYLSTYSDTSCEQVFYKCKANGQHSCQNKICEDYSTTDGMSSGYYQISSDQDCVNLDPTCKKNNASPSHCQTILQSCNQYSQDNCTSSSSEECIWVSEKNTCVGKNSPCELFSGTNCESYNIFCTSTGSDYNSPCTKKKCSDFSSYYQFTYSWLSCQNINSSCSVDREGKSCVDIQEYCSNYYEYIKCGYSKQQKKCYWNYDAQQCQSIEAQQCYLITGTQITRDMCQEYNKSCVANRDQTQCIQMFPTCDQYSDINDCVEASEGLCIQNQPQYDSYTKCISPVPNCSSLYLTPGTIYTHEICNKLNSKCTNNQTDGCQEKNCANKISPTSFIDCQSWLTSCTYNESNNCVQISDFCSAQNYLQCYQAHEGECTVINNKCVLKTCYQASLSYNSDYLCSIFMNKCTISQIGGCQSRTYDCSDYISQIQCKYDQRGRKCFWNPTNLNCIYLTCSNLEQTSYFDTHDECAAVDSNLKCTVRSQNGVAIPGCMDAARSCNSYLVEMQCHQNADGNPCQWNTNLTTPICQDKSCSTAPNSIFTHDECLQYYMNTICTLKVVKVNGAKIIGGCQPADNCSSYIAEEQCQINAQGNKCGWNGTLCADQSCQTAPQSYITDQQCKSYFQVNQCTLSSFGKGCMDIPATCETMILQEQCMNNSLQDTCYWNGEICITKTCDNVPEGMDGTIDGCSKYFSQCTFSTDKCHTQVCEDFNYTTDRACKSIMSVCTTDGQRCIKRGTCEQAQHKSGCVKSQDEQQCEWIESDGYCSVKSCITAPLFMNSEELCNSYFPNCIPKQGGGCIERSTCDAATVIQACTTSLDGIKCIWKNAACRNHECGDFQGSSHQMCYKQNNLCTIGYNDRCEARQLCELTTIKAACIIGIDDTPCLWIDGNCYSYSSCSSLTWTTHRECQKISKNCTTNGTKCVGITQCALTNVKGGCVIGTDGDCFMPNSSQCRSRCTSYSYKTHQECQQVYSNCTTNGKTCISLLKCNQYNLKEQCKIDDTRQECQWNQTSYSCENKPTQPSVSIQKCLAYSKFNCDNTLGIEGTCKWYNNYCHLECNNCVKQKDYCVEYGTQCIPKRNCNQYQTKHECSLEGTDGICIWNSSSCQLMTKCAQATDMTVCLKASPTCIWNKNVSKCQAISCSSYYQITGLCSVIQNLDNTILVCKFTENKCDLIDPATLSQAECFKVTKYTYTWDRQENKCLQCSKVQQQGIQVNNSNSVEQNPQTNSSIFGQQTKVVLAIMLISLFYI